MSFLFTSLALSAIRYVSSESPFIYSHAPSTCIETPSWHPKEEAYLNHFNSSFYQKYLGLNSDPQDILQFDPNDTRSKFLFATAESGSHIPGISPTTALVEELNEKYDLKYKVIKTYDELCDEIASTVKLTKLSYVLLEGEYHSEKGICLSDCSHPSHFFHPEKDLGHCFKDLDLQGRVVLYSDYTGERTFAQEVATAIKRDVIAPTDQLQDRVSLLDTKDLELQCPKKFVANGSVYYFSEQCQLVNPEYTDCQTVNETDLHPREQVVHEDLSQNPLVLCKDDPRKKFLYLSMEADWNGALNAEKAIHVLKEISSTYDLKYKVISSYTQLCNEVQATAEVGAINLIIDGHSNSHYIRISNDHSTNEQNLLSADQDLAKCFQGANITKITLLSCETNAPFNGKKEYNIAHTIANQARVPVVGATDTINAPKTQILSMDPFEVYHPSQCTNSYCLSEINTFETIDPSIPSSFTFTQLLKILGLWLKIY